jgi:hypothetical protein
MKKIILLAFALTLTLVACGDDKDSGGSKTTNPTASNGGNSTNPPTSQGGNDTTPSGNNGGENQSSGYVVVDSFKQFGADLDKVKPNIGTPDEVTIEYGNAVGTSVYACKASWMEESENDDIEYSIGYNYNERMFEYCKSISADGKCYYNYTESSKNPNEVASYEVLDSEQEIGLAYTWSYKVDGMWVDVYMEYTTDGDNDIGIRLGGADTY